MGKYKIEARISEKDAECWENFRNVVFQKHGKLNGVLGEELIIAMELYLEGKSQDVSTHTHQEEEEETGTGVKDEKQKRLGNGDIMVGRTREERLENIGCYLAWGSGEISATGLRRLIVSQKVGDKRVIDDYIRTMKLRGWIVDVGKRGFVMPVMRSAISAALGITLPKETLEKMAAGWRDQQVGLNEFRNGKGRTL